MWIQLFLVSLTSVTCVRSRSFVASYDHRSACRSFSRSDTKSNPRVRLLNNGEPYQLLQGIARVPTVTARPSQCVVCKHDGQNARQTFRRIYRCVYLFAHLTYFRIISPAYSTMFCSGQCVALCQIHFVSHESGPPCSRQPIHSLCYNYTVDSQGQPALIVSSFVSDLTADLYVASAMETLYELHC